MNDREDKAIEDFARWMSHRGLSPLDGFGWYCYLAREADKRFSPTPEDRAVLEAAEKCVAEWDGIGLKPSGVSLNLRIAVAARRAALQPKPRYKLSGLGPGCVAGIIDTHADPKQILSAGEVCAALNQAEESGRTGPRSGSVEQKGSQS